MIPRSPKREEGRCGATLIVTVFCATIALASSGAVPAYPVFQLQQTPAQDRAGIFDSFNALNPFASAPAPPAYNIPDVAGFGMYPLWKFHKFDGLSLRPVPYGVDIGKGLPATPDPPTNPISFYSGPSPAGTGPPQKMPYGGPPAPPATNYEQSPPSQPPNPYTYAAPSSVPSYASPQQPPQILNYVPNGPPSYPAPEAPASNNYGSSQPPMSLSYQPVSPQKYNEPSAPAYNAPVSAPAYGDQQYSAQPANPGYSPMNQPAAYDGGGMGGITIQFSAPPSQDYGMQQQQPTYSSSPAGSYNPMSSYSSIENPMTVSYQPIAEAKPMDYGNGGYYKRSSYVPEKEATKKMSIEEGIISSDGNSFSR